MKTLTQKQNIFSKIIPGLVVVGFLAFASFATADWAAPSFAPTGTNENINHFVTLFDATQVKQGRFGVVTTPPQAFDFRVDGHASFLGGIWTSSAVIRDKVHVGIASGPDRSVTVFSDDFQVFGDNANIQNDLLVHTAASPQLVCSNDQGVLRLCACDNPTNAAAIGATCNP